MDERSTMILLNFLACWIGVFMCACRLGHKGPKVTKLEIKAVYMVWLPTLVASSLSWTFGEPPSIAQLSLAMAVIAQFTIGYEAWRNGPPPYALKPAQQISRE